MDLLVLLVKVIILRFTINNLNIMFNNSNMFNSDMEEDLLNKTLLKMLEVKVQEQTMEIIIDLKNEIQFKSTKLLLKILLKQSLKILKQLYIRK